MQQAGIHYSLPWDPPIRGDCLPAGALAQAGDLPFPSMEPGYRFSRRHDKYMSLRIPDESQECGNLLPIPLGISFPGILVYAEIACLLQAGFSRSCGIVMTRKEKPPEGSKPSGGSEPSG